MKSQQGFLAVALFLACVGAFDGGAQAEDGQNGAEPPKETHASGLGELMQATQMRHAKLWLAGKAKNWRLAQYELGEIEEGLDDVVKYHPTFKDGARISIILPQFTAKPIDSVRQAVETKDLRVSHGFRRLDGRVQRLPSGLRAGVHRDQAAKRFFF